ncbi:hypothetical protein PAE4_20292 [Bacillus altitudinis]|uniref:Uncharacterized protein n=1 Tax=Bacillus altitudinis TaxID=293387 RepID=A0A653UFX1_BACAB|nr:hypothetical protein PAE4_20292 [Bacillus altitudinis]VXB88337.1 hypothetical protein BACI348_41797 [Bacillus altitudinis]
MYAFYHTFLKDGNDVFVTLHIEICMTERCDLHYRFQKKR